jgi:hypothetical protein
MHLYSVFWNYKLNAGDRHDVWVCVWVFPAYILEPLINFHHFCINVMTYDIGSHSDAIILIFAQSAITTWLTRDFWGGSNASDI